MARLTAASRLPASALPLRARRERGAVVYAGANDRQAEGDIDRVPETLVLDDRKALIVIHRDDDIHAVREKLRRERRVGGNGSAHVEPFAQAAA